MSKKLIIRLPKGAEGIRVYKEISLEDGTSIRVEVIERDAREQAPGNGGGERNVFLCSQDKVHKRFNPYDYACIETSHDHSVLLHPADAQRPVLAIKVLSMEKLLGQLERFGVKNFIRVSASYAVNIDYIEDYANSKLTLRGLKRPVLVKDSYKDRVDSRLCVITYKG